MLLHKQEVVQLVQQHQEEEEETASLMSFLSPMAWDSSSPTRKRAKIDAHLEQQRRKGRNQSFRWCCSRCRRSCPYRNQERRNQERGGFLRLYRKTMERALSSACCVFRGTLLLPLFEYILIPLSKVIIFMFVIEKFIKRKFPASQKTHG